MRAMTKICNTCGLEKDIAQFYKDSNNKDGYKNKCKSCMSKRKTNKVSKMDKNIRQCLIYCIKHNGPFSWSNILGYTAEEIRKHLEERFTDGMTFDNYGTVWGVTFYIPKRCYKFNSLVDDEARKCWSLKNLKPHLLSEHSYKAKISKKEVEEQNLWDILPVGNLADFFID
jgi:hypothetical protein